jgi:hypothetical protein
MLLRQWKSDTASWLTSSFSCVGPKEPGPNHYCDCNYPHSPDPGTPPAKPPKANIDAPPKAKIIPKRSNSEVPTSPEKTLSVGESMSAAGECWPGAFSCSSYGNNVLMVCNTDRMWLVYELCAPAENR